MSNTDKIIMGIDPGTNIMGYGIIHVLGSKVSLISLGIVDLKKLENQQLKIKRIFESVVSLVDNYKPDEVAIESPFMGQNVQSALKLGRAQGVAMAAVLSHDIPIVEYMPKKIKMAITGNGNADKEQVAYMLQKLLKFDEMPKYLDATDGLAAAYCHYLQMGKPSSDSRGGWDKFMRENPTRVIK